MFSLNALDPKLVWHIEKETKEGLGDVGEGGGGPNGQRETEGERRTQTARKTQGKKWRHRKGGKGNPKK